MSKFLRVMMWCAAVWILAIALSSDAAVIGQPFMTTQNDNNEPSLFELVGILKAESTASVAAVRDQEIEIKFDDIDFEAAEKLSFPLLDGRSYEAVRNEREGFVRFTSDEFTWRGKIFAENDFKGDVVFSIKGKALSGLIYSPTAVYEIIPQADFRHLLVELDQTRFPACGGAVPVQDPPHTNDESVSKVDSSGFADDGSQIDVLVTYTALVRQFLGGTAQAQAFAQQAIASTNTAYQNSDITMRLRLVGTLEVSYDEAAGTLSAALPWSRSDPETAATRNIVKADMVSIIIQNASDACGIGYLMSNVGPSFESNAFSAAARSCAVGNLTFAHELGHNQGAHHNPENAGSTPAFPYAYGHYVDASFRTVMSYVNQCPSGCSRVPYFSNPAISFNGSPTGIADARDNHRCLNNTALTVSQFRDGLVATLTPTNTPSPTSTASPTPTNTLTATATATSTPTPVRNILINEVDSDTPCADFAEFVELFDGGIGSTPLDGLVVVFYDGANDTSYAAFDLDGYQTNASGYFTLGNTSVSGVDLVFAEGLLQNGADAVAVYNSNATNFPPGTLVTTTNIIDALVYDTGQPDDAGLLTLLNPGQPQVNENANFNREGVSMQRCPNGSGGLRNTGSFAMFVPSSDGVNSCVATPTITPTPAQDAISGRVTYGNASGPLKSISNATVASTAGSPFVSTTTNLPGVTAGQYTLTGFGSSVNYTIGVTKTTGQNGISSNDAARIAQHVAGISPITANNQKIAADTSANGTISSNDAALIATFAVGLGGSIGSTNQWRFFLPGPTFPIGSSPTTRSFTAPIGTQTCQDYTGILIGEVSGNWNNTGARPINTSKRNNVVALPNLGVPVGEQIIVPISVQDASDKEVISYEFDLRYDPTVIRPEIDELEATKTVSRGLSIVVNAHEPGLLRVVAYGAVPIDRDGVLLNLRFTAIGSAGAVSPLSFERIMFNEGEPSANVSGGQIRLF